MPHSRDDFNYLHLPPAERILLAQEILDSVVAEAEIGALSPDQIAEMRRRAAAIDAGEIACEPLEPFRDRLLKD